MRRYSRRSGREPQAYLLKDASEDELLETIRALRRGESRLTPQIARKVMDQFRRLAQTREPLHSPPDPAAAGHRSHSRLSDGGEAHAEALTEKEDKVLSLITEGCTNREIAQAMSLAEGTIKNYVSRIMDKLHANTRIELALLARRQRRNG